MDNNHVENNKEQSANVSDISQRLVYVNEKILRITEENDKAKAVISKQDTQIDELQNRFKKLTAIGERYGVTLEKHKEESNQNKQMQERLEVLQKQKMVMLKAAES